MVNNEPNTGCESSGRASSHGDSARMLDRLSDSDFGISSPVCVPKVNADALRLAFLPAWMAYEKLLRIVATDIQQGGLTAKRAAAGFERRVEQCIATTIDKFFPMSDADSHHAAVARIEAMLLLIYDANSAAQLAAAGINPHQPGGNPALLRRLTEAASWFPIDVDGRLPTGTLGHCFHDRSDDKKDRLPPRPPGQWQMRLRLSADTNPTKKLPRVRPAVQQAVSTRVHHGRQWRYLPALRSTTDQILITHIGKRIGKVTVKGLWAEDSDYWVVRCDCGAYELRSRPEVSGKQPCKGACSHC